MAMSRLSPISHRHSRRTPLCCALATLVLAACGGGSTNAPEASAAAPAGIASGVTVLQLSAAPSLPASAAAQLAQPAFHVAPVFLNEPDDADALDNSHSAGAQPHVQALPAELQHLSSRQLTVPVMQAARYAGVVHPNAGSGAVSTYTPAQIRAAYGLPALPASNATPTATQAAQLGAGQTIYIVDAMHDPNVAAELTAFNQKFGLPTCTQGSLPASGSPVLPAASQTACQLYVVYSTGTTGSMTATPPAYDSGWATEIALDVQWSHATAPLARIVLIEVPGADLNSLLGGVNLANAMGPGVVSMSFGAAEGPYTSATDTSFQGAKMSYVASTGDSGAAVSWPSVSPYVLAVGGTSLTYTGSGARQETTWSGTGGGVSAYTAAPAYQTSAVPGMGSQSKRNVADVSFNADPNTGQYLAVIPQGSSSVNWLSAGGTSISAPQWAGLIASANALRAQAGRAPLGAPHAALYTQVASVAGTYAQAFADITTGSDGSCGTCSAKAGYDTPTGLGTPNVTNLLPNLSGTATAPVVTGASIAGAVGTPLTFTPSVTAADPVTLSLSGAPTGMQLTAAGVISWPVPVAGTVTVTVTATDTKNALKGSGNYVITIAPPQPPTVPGGSISGHPGTALSFATNASGSNPLTYTLSGAPTGMSISSAGLVSWAAPVLGSYKVTVQAKDSKNGLTAQGVYTVSITAVPPPSLSAGSITGTSGTPLSYSVAFSASNAVTFSLSGQPSGMSISAAGVISWASPVVGSYTVTVKVVDTVTGLSSSAAYSVKITAPAAGLTIQAPAMVGVAGKPLTGTIVISDPGVSSLGVSISGVPLGMGFSANGLSITAQWASPVTGSYSLHVQVQDSAGHTAQATVPVTITAK